ncbi:GumC family protein, partial [Xanthovirga aplysinae]|uniref:GumC family protein n=1 Tax=Xanthovirga aplysinae TaxID=2529853 RepID=UPI0012BBBE60
MGFQQEEQFPEDVIDLRSIILRVSKYRFFFLAVLIISIFLGLIYFSYSKKQYSINTSILITSNNDTDKSTLQLPYGSEFNFKNDLTNEILIIKSHPLVRQVIDSLALYKTVNFQVGMREKELYKQNPVGIEFISQGRNIEEFEFTIKIKSEKGFYIVFQGSNEEKFFRFGDILRVNGEVIKVNLLNRDLLKDYIGGSLICTIKNIDDVTEKLINDLLVEPHGQRSSVLNISINDNIPERGEDILNVLLDLYQKQKLKLKHRNYDKTLTFIDRQLRTIKDSLYNVEKRWTLFRGENAPSEISEMGLTLLKKIKNLEEEKYRSQIKLKYLSYLLKGLSEDRIDSFVVPSSLDFDDPILDRLIGDLFEAQKQYKILLRNGGESNPYTEKTKEEVIHLKLSVIGNIKNIQGAEIILFDEISQRIVNLGGELKKLPQVERNYIDIKRIYDLNEKFYVALMEKRAEAGISKATHASEVFPINPPRSSKKPVSYGLIEVIAISFGLSLTVSFGGVLLIIFFDKRLYSKEYIEENTRIPILGEIPHFNGMSQLVVKEIPFSLISENFRSIRSKTKKLSGEGSAILVTSCLSGEGKTTFSSNFALTMAAASRRTILVFA